MYFLVVSLLNWESLSVRFVTNQGMIIQTVHAGNLAFIRLREQ